MTAFYILGTLIVSTIRIHKLPLLLLPWFCSLFIFASCSGIRKKFFKSIKKAAFVAIIIFLVQAFIVPGGEVLFRFGILRICSTGLITGTNLSLLILNIAGIFVWLFQTTEYKEISRALEDNGLNYKACFLFLSTMQMIELLGRNSRIILNAQKARGVETEGNVLIRAKAFIPSMVPLVLGAIISSEDRVLTLESKGFDVNCKKTHILNVEKTGNEKWAICIGIGILLFLLIGRIVLWIQ